MQINRAAKQRHSICERINQNQSPSMPEIE